MNAKSVLRLAFGLTIAAASGIGPVAAATIHVDASATGTIEDGSPLNPYDTIQKGLDAAVEGDMVLVAHGIYYGAIDQGK